MLGTPIAHRYHIYRERCVCVFQVGTTYAANCQAYGPGKEASVAGETAYFTIQAIDQFGYNITSGGNQFAINISTSSSGATPGTAASSFHLS